MTRESFPTRRRPSCGGPSYSRLSRPAARAWCACWTISAEKRQLTAVWEVGAPDILGRFSGARTTTRTSSTRTEANSERRLPHLNLLLIFGGGEEVTVLSCSTILHEGCLTSTVTYRRYNYVNLSPLLSPSQNEMVSTRRKRPRPGLLPVALALLPSLPAAEAANTVGSDVPHLSCV